LQFCCSWNLNSSKRGFTTKTRFSPGFICHIFLIAIVFSSLTPIFFALFSSLQAQRDLYGGGIVVLPKTITFENYIKLFTRLPLVQITLNTFIIALAVTAFKVITSVIAAYAFAFLDFKGKNVLYFALISTIFIPFTVTMIPNYLTVSSFRLNDTLLGVILPQLGDATGIFLIRQAMKSIPKSLFEIARLEKIGHLKIIRDIMVPISSPSIISAGIIFFNNAWNDYVWPSIIIRSKENYTLSLALQMFVDAEAGTEITVVMALSVIAMVLPITLYLIFQKQIMNTFASSGIKG
jgi:sn-glycerol 3-phosphate transport system permease protein